jgi:predicted aconitase with swiveling domain
MVVELKGRKICNGKAEGEVLYCEQGISFFGGVDTETGKVSEQAHPLFGQSITGKILVFPQGKGSTVGSYALYRMKKQGTAPKAIVNSECETIVAVGAIISEIPCIDKIDISKLKNAKTVSVDAEKGLIVIKN